MTITAAYANADNTLVSFTANGVTRTVPADWEGEFRDGIGGVVGFLERGGVIGPYVASAPTIDDVKAEAHRRCIAVLPEHHQRNLTNFAVKAMQDHGVNPSLWPADVKEINDDARVKWAAIKAIRAKSDEIEAMNPIPANFRNDSYWT